MGHCWLVQLSSFGWAGLGRFGSDWARLALVGGLSSLTVLLSLKVLVIDPDFIAILLILKFNGR